MIRVVAKSIPRSQPSHLNVMMFCPTYGHLSSKYVSMDSEIHELSRLVSKEASFQKTESIWAYYAYIMNTLGSRVAHKIPPSTRKSLLKMQLRLPRQTAFDRIKSVLTDLNHHMTLPKDSLNKIHSFNSLIPVIQPSDWQPLFDYAKRYGDKELKLLKSLFNLSYYASILPITSGQPRSILSSMERQLGKNAHTQSLSVKSLISLHLLPELLTSINLHPENLTDPTLQLVFNALIVFPSKYVLFGGKKQLVSDIALEIYEKYLDKFIKNAGYVRIHLNLVRILLRDRKTQTARVLLDHLKEAVPLNLLSSHYPAIKSLQVRLNVALKRNEQMVDAQTSTKLYPKLYHHAILEHLEHRNYENAYLAYLKMKEQGIKPYEPTLHYLMIHLVRGQQYDWAIGIYRDTHQFGYTPSLLSKISIYEAYRYLNDRDMMERLEFEIGKENLNSIHTITSDNFVSSL